MTPIGDHAREIAYGGAEFAPDGTLWVDLGRRLGLPAARPDRRRHRPLHAGGHRHRRRRRQLRHRRGRQLHRLRHQRGGNRPAAGCSIRAPAGRGWSSGLPAGIIGGVQVAPWGAVGFTFTSARSAADAYSVDPRTLAVTRWTRSETGGLDTNVNVEPELVEVQELRRRAGVGLPLPARRAALPGPPAADRQHPWRARSPVAAGLPRPQQLSDQRARHRHLLSERPRLAGLRQALRQPRQRPGAAREFGSRHRRLPRPAGRRSARSIRRASRSPAAPMAAICATPRRSPTASGCAPPIASSPSPTSSPSSRTPRATAATCRRVEYGDERTQRAELLRISPMTRVSELRIPLMVVTGANDPRVPAIGGRPDGRRGPRRGPAGLAPDRPE